MATKQKQKSLQTRAELKDTALRLFEEKGCENVSVADIVSASGYSVGAFYGHFKTKQDLISELWCEYTVHEIETSVEYGSKLTDKEELIDYLIRRSNETAKNKAFTELQQYGNTSQESAQTINKAAGRYTAMLGNALARWAPNASFDTVWTTASIMHSILISHVHRFDDFAPYLTFENQSIRKALMMMIDMCVAESGSKAAAAGANEKENDVCK